MARSLGLLCLSLGFGLAYTKKEKEAVVFVVDPDWDCVESYVAKVPVFLEYKIIKVMIKPGKSNWCNSDHADIYMNITYGSSIPNDALAAEDLCPKLRDLDLNIAAVIPTFDTGVGLTDRLAACVGTRGNPFEGPLANARRDKWAMGEAVRKAGLRAVKEKIVTSWSEAKEYLEALNPPLAYDHPVIFKILKGSSSSGVQKVHSMEQAEKIFKSEVGGKSVYGDEIGELLIQEFLKGKEYVIDSASRDGVHKVVMVWNEDLRPGNGIFDLYYGFKAMDPQDPKIKSIIEYSNKVLDATGLRNGASDMEVIWLEDEGQPCLVEINARWTALMWHSGLDLEKAIGGNDQITATANAYLDADAFNKMPAVPSFNQHGAIMFVNAHHTSILKGIPGMAVVKAMPTFYGSADDGAFVGKLIKMNTAGNPPITVLLASKNEAEVDADYNRIVKLEDSDLFFDVVPSPGSTSLTSLRKETGAPTESRVVAMVACAMIAAVAVLTFAAKSRGNDRDGTEYLFIE